MVFSNDNVSAFIRYAIIVLTISAACLFGIGLLIYLIPQIVLKIAGILVMGCGALMLWGILAAFISWKYHKMRRISDKSHAGTMQGE